MKKITYLLITLFCMAGITACSSDDSDKTIENSKDLNFDTAQLATTDGVGTFNVVLNASGTTLNLQLTSIAGSGIILETGTYNVTRSRNEEYSVLSDRTKSFWTDESNISHTVATGKITVSTSGTNSKLIGTVADKDGKELRFTTGNITFSTIEESDVVFTKVLSKSYSLQVSNGSYGMVLANEDSSIGLLIYFYNAPASDTEKPVLPAGRYIGETSGMQGAIFMNNSYWLNATTNTEHHIKSATCYVEYQSGEAILNGNLIDKDGKAMHFTYKGKLDFGNYRKIDMNFFNSMAGQWTLNSDLWWVYTSKTKTWGESETPKSQTKRVMQWIGVPDYGRFFATGLWDANASGIFIVSDGDDYYIPAGYQANPAFIAISSSDNYYIFPTLYDPETGYYVSSGKIPMYMSEDGKSLTIPPLTKIITDSETGKEIEITYNYFGGIGHGLTYGGTTLFSNYCFAHMPTMDHNVESRSSSQETSMQDKRLNALCSILQCGGAFETEKITNKIPEDVISVISINK